jgi:hypothetical protein
VIFQSAPDRVFLGNLKPKYRASCLANRACLVRVALEYRATKRQKIVLIVIVVATALAGLVAVAGRAGGRSTGDHV